MQLSVVRGPDRISNFRNAALVMAHPRHDLKVFGWLSECRPRVHILTDGSGCGTSRLHSTAKLLHRIGVVQGEVFGLASDAEMYRAILEKRIPIFLRMVDGLAASFIEHDTDFVVGDAIEGFNPTHDICRALLNAAASIVRHTTGRLITNYEFCLTEWERHRREVHDQHCWHLRLNDSLLQKKLSAAADYVELKSEIQQAIAFKGEEYFRIECMRNVIEPLAAPLLESGPASKPYYETHGEERVAQDKYASVLRHEQHMLPILRAVRDYALEGGSVSNPGLPSTTVAGHH